MWQTEQSIFPCIKKHKIIIVYTFKGLCHAICRLSQSRSRGFLVWCGRTRGFRSLALRGRTIALRAHCRATRSKARLVSKSTLFAVSLFLFQALTLFLSSVAMDGHGLKLEKNGPTFFGFNAMLTNRPINIMQITVTAP